MASPDIVLFAIQGALKLGLQARAAYVDSTRNRELALPLPDFEPSPSPAAAAHHFLQRDEPTEPPQLRDLVRKLKRNQALTAEESKLLMLYHEDDVLKSLAAGGSTRAQDGSTVPASALSALVTIRQWERGGEPDPSALQRLAGTFLDLGVDYFVAMPGGLDPNSRTGKALRALFAGFDGISFATEPLGDLPARMFSATMESIAANASLVTQDPKVQELISAATSGLAAEVAERIRTLREAGGADPKGEARIRGWGELAFRSVLSSVGKRLADEPGRFLGVKGEANAALVAGVANAAISVVLDQPKIGLESVFSAPALERMADAALGVVSRYPELVTGEHNRLKELVSQIAADLAAKERLIANQAIPEIAQLILSRTAENLPLLWPGAARDPKKHLGLTAARKTLEILARKPAEGERWKPAFSAADLAAVTDHVLAELVENPGWLISKSGELGDALETALDSMLGVLRRLGDERIGTQLAVHLIEVGLSAAASRSEFLASLPDGKPIIAAILEAVLGTALDAGADEKVQWRLLKNELMLGMFDTALRKLAASKLDAAKLTVLRQVLANSTKALRAAEAWDLERFARELEGALAT